MFVGHHPLRRDLPRILQRAKEPGIKHLRAVRAIEALDVGILVRFPGLNMPQRDALRLAPLGERLRNQFRSVVEPQFLRAAMQRHELIQHFRHAPTRQRGFDFDREDFPIALVEHIEGPKWAPILEPIMHEVERPGLIEHRGGIHRLPRPRRHPPLDPPPPHQAQRAVHAPNALGIPRPPEEAESIRQQIAAPPRAFGGEQGLHRVDHRPIPLGLAPCRSVIRRPRQSHYPARPHHRQAVFGDQQRDDLPLRGRRYSFRLSTSLIAAYSIASSAYIRLSFA